MKRINEAAKRTNMKNGVLEFTPYGKPERTPEGFLIIPVIIAKKMVLDYPEFGTHELMGDAIFSEEYLNSCNGCPLVLDHPKKNGVPIDVSPENYKDLMKGVLIDPLIVDKNFEPTDDPAARDMVVGKVKILNADIIEDVEARDLVQLSQGYSCAVKKEAGVWDGKPFDSVQTDIIMNHLALVENGRAGDFVKVLYNNNKVSLAAADFERIERRRVNMVFTQFKKLSSATQETILKRINMAPKDFFRLNTDEQAEKIKNEDMTPDEKKEIENEDNPAPSVEDRMSALEKTMNTLSETINKMANGARNETSDEEKPKTENEAENPAPDKDEKKLENKVNSAVNRLLPMRINEYATDAENSYMQARALVGESFQAIAQRCNGVLPEFRKEILLQVAESYGYSKDEIKRMNALEVKATLDVLARSAKLSINDARRSNSGHGRTDGGDIKVREHYAF